MRYAVVLASVLATMMFAADVSAQTPDFSGSWTLDAPPGGGGPPTGGGGGPGGGGGGRGGGGALRGLGMNATVTQTASALTVTRSMAGNEVEAVYNLDGSPSTNTLSFGPQSIDQTSTAAWDGGSLVITTDGQFGETAMTLSLNGEDQLIVETTGGGPGGGAPTTTTLTYNRD